MAKANIMIVEDERIVAADIESILEKLGHGVTGIVSSGKQALEQAELKKPDLVLMDIMIEGDMKGIEAAGRIRSEFNIPVIFITAYADEQTLGQAKLTEPYGYLVKPFDEIELNSTVEIALYKHRMEKKLRESEAWLFTTLQSIGDAVITTDTESRVTFINSVAEDLTGYDSDFAKGKQLGEVFNIINERTRQKVTSPVETVLASGKIVGLANHTILVARDGTEYQIADSGAPIRTEDGKTSGVVLVFRDMTDEYRTRRELQNISKLRSVGTLAGGIAHDFKNILTGIYANISLLKEHVAAADPARKHIDRVEESMDRATRLATQLLTFAKGGDPVKNNVHLGELIEEVVRFDLSGSNVMPVFEGPKDLWSTEVDKSQLQQVVSNLTTNANQAMPDGGHLYIRLENKRVNGGGRPGLEPGHYLRITFRDEGVGIEPERLDRVFEPYFSTKETGSGLGLATCYSIIDRHGGHISVESNPGQGTCFTVYLPATPETARSETREVEQARDSLKLTKNAKVLVMDDEEFILEVVREILQSNGFTVETAVDGEEAIAKHKNAMDSDRPFAAVILDLTIPGGLGGKEAVSKILETDPDVYTIVSSGYSGDPVLAHYADFGFKAFLTKPYSKKDLLALLG